MSTSNTSSGGTIAPDHDWLAETGHVTAEELQEIPGSNVSQNKLYDQIAFRVRPGRLETTGRAGVFDIFEVVYRDDDELLYVDEMGERYHVTSRGDERDDPSRYYKTYWRTHQISDHLPMWVELSINHAEPFLKRLLDRAERG